MARIKNESKVPDSTADNDPRLSDDIRKFIIYAGDLIQEQRSVRQGLDETREALSSISTAYGKTSRDIARRESEAVTVHLGTDILLARKQIAHALTEPLARAEAIARETRLTALLSGLSGGFIGAAMVSVLLIFDVI